MKLMLTTLVAGAALALSAPLAAQDDDPWPFEAGEYVEVTGIKLADGAGLKYAQWLAGEWRSNSDFAVEQGWLNSYEILVNTHPREGEPNMYLIRRFPSFVDNEEGERRRQVMSKRYQRSAEALQQESANRAEYRTVMSEVLMRKLEWDD